VLRRLIFEKQVSNLKRRLDNYCSDGVFYYLQRIGT